MCFVIFFFFFLYFAAAQNIIFYIDVIIHFAAGTKQFPEKDYKVLILLSQVTVIKLPLKVNQNRKNRKLCTETSQNASLTSFS